MVSKQLCSCKNDLAYMAGRDAREGHGVGVLGVGNLACSSTGNF